MTVKAATHLRDELRLGIRRQDRRAGLHGGVYVIPWPYGLYVGSATDCYRRNVDLIARGFVDWAIVREMPGSTHAERMRAETEVADAWAARGWPVITRNTSYRYSRLLETPVIPEAVYLARCRNCWAKTEHQGVRCLECGKLD
jgi:hypothetical protein